QAPWGVIAGGCLLLFLGAVLRSSLSGSAMTSWLRGEGRWTLDTLAGMATISLILWCTRRCLTSPDQAHSGLTGFLESRPVAHLGEFSYSLYLVHAPVLGITHLLLLKTSLSPTGILAALFCLGIPLSLGAARLFYQLFERPFKQ